MNLTDAEMRALVRLGYSVALADHHLQSADVTSEKNGRFIEDGISVERLNEILSHVPPDAIRDELVAAGLRSSKERLP